MTERVDPIEIARARLQALEAQRDEMRATLGRSLEFSIEYADLLVRIFAHKDEIALLEAVRK